MSRTALFAATLAAATLLALTACNSDNSSGSSDKPKKATTPVPTKSIDAALGFPPKPTGAKKTAYLAAIGAVDPTLTQGNEERVINAGRDQCQALTTGAKNPDHLAAERFGTDTHPLTDAQGKALNAALKKTLCPK